MAMVRTDAPPAVTLVVSRPDLVEHIQQHSRFAAWNGNWAIQWDPNTGRHAWCWIGRFPPIGTDPERGPREGWRALILPRIDATKLAVDARKDRVEDWVWKASADGALDGWIEAGEAARAGVKFTFAE